MKLPTLMKKDNQEKTEQLKERAMRIENFVDNAYNFEDMAYKLIDEAGKKTESYIPDEKVYTFEKGDMMITLALGFEPLGPQTYESLSIDFEGQRVLHLWNHNPKICEQGIWKSVLFEAYKDKTPKL